MFSCLIKYNVLTYVHYSSLKHTTISFFIGWYDGNDAGKIRSVAIEKVSASSSVSSLATEN